MGNFEKLSVLVIGVIIVMILVVALYTWTDDPADELPGVEKSNLAGRIDDVPQAPDPEKDDRWDDWVKPAPPAAPKPVAAVEDRPDENGSRLEDEVHEAADKPVADKASAPAPVERTYTVKANDTLGGIALSEMGSTKYWQLIQERNDVDPMKLRPGMTLVIPAIEGTAVAPNKAVADVAAGGPARPGSSYTVRKGDTIQKIAQSAYKNIERWTDIWFANMERISDPRSLPTGITIEIPN